MSDSLVYRDGSWQPDIPLPFLFTGWVRCGQCRRIFIGRAHTHSRAYRRYERHYRRAHMPP